ncbi:CheY chemotaxis protein or a CheY-like REC (receiver) domain [Marinomonas polaris DSM 16579]|uniref:CheY chemotaxis protein or a CheY-like REC (Receiver) domain n=1 Tax=Marinomonas polaris DSM 16579 TaxID=1122206 RepID=A0A1M4STW4_9GAMM|nr:response regulator [Marinomonas polaris]SHE35592.1 CheY chemotaxis protein or a CheY-like REC (receiver) domain [Marinomonas polaris DSM 16579]
MTDVIALGVENTNDIHQGLIDLSKKRVLIIEDIGEMRLMLKSLMTSMGYSNIDVEPSGQSAIKRILERPYDVVLSDYNLGGSIDGQQILETSRKNYSQDHSTIFIMITADTAYESVVSVLEYQPDSYLVKPFPPAAFFRRFERVQKQKKTFEGINTARKENDFEKMEAQAKAIMTQYPNLASQCLKIIGESLYARGRYKDAKNHYMLIIQKSKNLAWAHYGIALCEFKLGTVAAAIKKLEHTIGLSRHFLSAYDLLADAHEDLGNLEDAQAVMSSVLDVSPRSTERALRLAQISMQLNDWPTAEQAYSKVIRLTRETSHEKVEYYYEYLKCLTNIMANSSDNSKLAEKFKRTLVRLRTFGKANPAAISNSFRVEIQQYLTRDHVGEAIKSWKQWNRLIKSGQATPLTDAQKHTLKKRLGLL